jgi:hypothetical protein
MLFDLTSRGRRSVVKIIYTALALLMGAGFLLFGVGTGVGGGGLFDSIFGNGSTSTKAQFSSAEKHAHHETVLDPKNAKAWADLTRARFQGADYDTSQQAFTEAGRVKLQSAASAWQTYLKLDPQKPDPAIAGMMAQAYSQAGLNQPADAASALEIVAAARPSAATYGQLANYAYQANETRKGDLAAAKAVQLAPKAQRTLVKRQLASIRRQVQQQEIQQAVQNGNVTSTPTPAPKKKK